MVVISPDADFAECEGILPTVRDTHMLIEFRVVRMRRMRIARDPHAGIGLIFEDDGITDMNADE